MPAHSQTPLNRITPGIVKAKDVTPGTVIMLGTGTPLAPSVARTVVKVARAVDEIERLRTLIGAPRRPSIDALCDLSGALSYAAQAVAFEGREARLIYFEDFPAPRSYASQDELRVPR